MGKPSQFVARHLHLSGVFRGPLLWFALFIFCSGVAQATPTTCIGTVADSYTPGLTNTSQLIHRTTITDYPSCTELLPLWSGTAHGESIFFDSQMSCEELELPGGSPIGNKTLTWSDGETSVWNGPAPLVTRVDNNTVIVRTSTVLSGRYLGKTVIETLVYPNLQIDACATNGVTQLNGVATMVIQ